MKFRSKQLALLVGISASLFVSSVFCGHATHGLLCGAGDSGSL